MVVFTIVSRNYFAFARALVASLRAQHPQATLYVAIADRHAEGLDAGTDGVELLPCQELGLADLAEMAFSYTILEFNTALKAACFRHLFARHPGEPIVYLDPDIWVLRPLAPVVEAFDAGADLVLTPHITEPRDREWAPSDLRLLTDGVYNLGFCGLRETPETRALVDWWVRHLRTDCRSASEEGVFVDQKWMEMAPCFAGHTAVLRDPGLNLAYWNLPQRPVEAHASGGYTAAGAPLAFVHFSGVRAEDPPLFCKYYPELTDEQLQPALRDLYHAYVAELGRQGYVHYRQEPYGFGHFADGTRIREGHRIYYRHYLRGTLATSPFELGAAFFDAPDPELEPGGPPYVSRLLRGVWRKWPELQQRFDLTTLDGRRGFWHWVREHGAQQEDLPPLDLPANLHDPASAQPTAEVESLRADLAARERDLAALKASTSWRVTAPLRALIRGLRGR